jgi:hypothetical protein
MVERAARIAHEINRAYCQALGDKSQPKWELAPEEIKDSVRAGVRFHLENPEAGPEASHERWLAHKQAAGWRYGPVKDFTTKEHPCMMPFLSLPKEQQAKDYLFRAVVREVTR